MSTTPQKIFFSYSKHDRVQLESLLKHLSPLTKNGKIAPWDDSKLMAGEEWDDKIKSELNAADIIVLLTSANAIATNYIWDVEIKSAMQRHEAGTAIVIPVIIDHCDWSETPLAKLNGLPRKGKPVSSFENEAEAWMQVVDGIKAVINQKTNTNQELPTPTDLNTADTTNTPTPLRPTKSIIQNAEKIYNIDHLGSANFS